MRAVNLLPRDQGQRQIKKESLPVLVGACSGLLVAAVLGALFLMGSGKVAAQQRTLDDLNRRYQAVKVTVPLVGVTVDLGDCILLTTTVAQRAIEWEQKKFCVTAIEYRPDLQTGEFQAVLTCDEVL